MTIVVVRNGEMAADSRFSAEGLYFRGQKIFRKNDVLIGIAGDVVPAMLFVDWYGTPGPPPPELLSANADFSALVLSKAGLFEFDKWCKGLKVHGRFYAIGSGAAVALGALQMGANARAAARVACKFDSGCGLPIVTMSLKV